MSGFPSQSKVQICGINKHECGYCKDSATGAKSKNSSISYGFVAGSVTVEDYQSIMLTGWRRSGTYFYRPVMHKTCCPQYTIRLRVNDHTLSKSQKKVLKNVKKFLSEESDDSSHCTEDNLKISPMFTFKNTVKASETDSTPTTPSNRNALKLTVELERPSVTAEKYELYKRYQIDVHHDKAEDISEQGFRRFLVDSPLKGGPATTTSPTSAPTSSPTTTNTKANSASTTSTNKASSNDSQYGTFHQLYRLNGQLIAVGVVDLLPLGLSSVYLFYDNNYKQLSLGKYTALREIEYCKTHAMEYYFMGFYIHTCEKMRYKGEYKPSDLLCPTTLQWYPLAQCGKILDKFNFSPFEPVLAARRALVDADVGTRPGSCRGSGGRVNGGTGNGVDSGGTGVSDTKDDTASDTPTTNTNGNNTIIDNNTASNTPATDSTTSTTTNASTPTSDPKKSSADSSTAKSESEAEVESEVEEEEGEEVPPSPLDEFAPIFDYISSTNHIDGRGGNTNSKTTTTITPNTANHTLLTAINSIPLDIGLGRPITLSDLKAESIRHLQPFLQEWIEHVGALNGTKLTVSLV